MDVVMLVVAYEYERVFFLVDTLLLFWGGYQAYRIFPKRGPQQFVIYEFIRVVE